jgi:hypothetical protein
MTISGLLDIHIIHNEHIIENRVSVFYYYTDSGAARFVNHVYK